MKFTKKNIIIIVLVFFISLSILVPLSIFITNSKKSDTEVIIPAPDDNLRDNYNYLRTPNYSNKFERGQEIKEITKLLISSTMDNKLHSIHGPKLISRTFPLNKF